MIEQLRRTSSLQWNPQAAHRVGLLASAVSAQLVQAAPGPTGAYDLRVVVYTISGLSGAIGARLGASAALVALIGTSVAYLGVPSQWQRILALGGRLLAKFFARSGMVRAQTDFAAGNEVAWQVAIFLVLVLVSHLLGALLTGLDTPPAGHRRLQRLADRMLGALLGALTGLLVARFALGRLAVSATVSPWSAQPPREGSLAATVAVAVFILLIGLYGVLSMGHRRRQVYDG